MTVLFVEHDMDIVSRYTHRVLAFYEGRIIADGDPEAVLKDAEVRRYVIGEQLHTCTGEDAVLRLKGWTCRSARSASCATSTWSCPPAKFTGLIGRNGAGKTTLMRSIMGILTPRNGSIHFDGATLDTLPTHLRARAGIGYMPEDRRLVPNLSVEENVLMPAWASRLPDMQARLAKSTR